MGFDRDAARRSILPQQDERRSRYAQQYAAMIANLKAGIDAALDTIARQNYQNGGSIVYEDGDFAARRTVLENPNRTATRRVAWVFAENFISNDGSEYYERFFIDEERNITMSSYDYRKERLPFAGLGVKPVFQYSTSSFNPWDVIPRLCYPLLYTTLLQGFINTGVPVSWNSIDEYALWKANNAVVSELHT